MRWMLRGEEMMRLLNVLRYIVIAAFGCAAILFVLGAIASYPIIVIADSDHGASSFRQMRAAFGWAAIYAGFACAGLLRVWLNSRLNVWLNSIFNAAILVFLCIITIVRNPCSFIEQHLYSYSHHSYPAYLLSHLSNEITFFIVVCAMVLMLPPISRPSSNSDSTRLLPARD